MEKTTLYLPSELHRALRETSRRTGVPQAELIREALRDFLRRQTAPTPRSIGLGDDAELTGRDSESWLRGRWRGP